VGNKAILSVKNFSSSKTIYIINQKEDKNDLLMIHPFYKNNNLIQYLIDKKIKIHTDHTLDVDYLKKIKLSIISLLTRSLENRNDSDTFWYRMIGAFGFSVFLFFFTSFVIRDPIVLIDEILISLGGGIFVFLLSVTLKLFNFVSSNKIDLYSNYINSIQIYESKALKMLNDFFQNNSLQFSLSSLEQNNQFDQIRQILKEKLNSFKLDDLMEVKDFIQIIQDNFHFKHLKFNQKKFLKELKSSYLSELRFNFYYLISSILL
jgi:hypothetical protein